MLEPHPRAEVGRRARERGIAHGQAQARAGTGRSTHDKETT
jgi:hypothetical protein